MPPGSSDRPLVFAHRGASAELPEHTRSAYQLALKLGVDGLECDVRLTRDGHLVCLHDRRLERTSNGRGVVSAHTLAELERLDFGDGEGVLTLDELLKIAAEAGRPVRLLVETKHPTRYGSAVERALATLLGRHGLLEPAPDAPVAVTVMSFSPLALRVMLELAPALPRVVLFDRVSGWPRRGRLPYDARVAGPSLALVRSRPQLVPRLREPGNQVYVWTVNDLADVRLMLELGVDGIITDRPGDVLRQVRGGPPTGSRGTL